MPVGKSSDINLAATIRAAAPWQNSREKGDRAISIVSGDIRENVRERKVGCAIVFVVDSSGSMGAKQRMIASKGAVLSLLLNAYQKRDRVGMIVCKGKEAQTVLPLTDSVEQAKTALEKLPTGGKSPISSGLSSALTMIRRERRTEPSKRAMVILISDGRFNVSQAEKGNPYGESEELAKTMENEKIRLLAIDTETGLIRLGKMEQLCRASGGIYRTLENLTGETLVEEIRLRND